MFSCAEISSEIVLHEKIWVQRVPALVLLSARIPCTCPRGITFLEESPGVSVESHLLLLEFWGTKFLGVD